MTNTLLDKELDENIYALLDNSISVEDLEILQSRLRSELAARSRYHELIRLHNLLEIESEQAPGLGQSNILPVENTAQ